MGYAWQLLADTTIGTATTAVDFTGLSITKDDFLLLVSEVYNPTVSACSYRFFCNDTTTENSMQYIDVDNATRSIGRVTSSGTVYCEAGFRVASHTNIKIGNTGYVAMYTKSNRKVGSTSTYIDFNAYSTSYTVTSLTKLTISANVANAIGIGSRFQLYKIAAEKIADVTISTAATTTDITSLSIGKDNEYLLIADLVNGTGSASDYRITINGTNTFTSYYGQVLRASNATFTQSRINSTAISRANTSTSSISFSHIKLTNDGYFLAHAHDGQQYVDTAHAIDVGSYTNSSTFTATSITQMRITATTASAIGINSRFTLYKMK